MGHLQKKIDNQISKIRDYQKLSFLLASELSHKVYFFLIGLSLSIIALSFNLIIQNPEYSQKWIIFISWSCLSITVILSLSTVLNDIKTLDKTFTYMIKSQSMLENYKDLCEEILHQKIDKEAASKRISQITEKRPELPQKKDFLNNSCLKKLSWIFFGIGLLSILLLIVINNNFS